MQTFQEPLELLANTYLHANSNAESASAFVCNDFFYQRAAVAVAAALFNTRCEYILIRSTASSRIVIHAKSYSTRVGGGGGGDDDDGGIDNVYLFIRRTRAGKYFLRQSLTP